MDEAWQDEILMAIPSINGAALLARMLPTLRFKPANIVVLDQGSSDDTGRLCAEAGVELMQLGQPHTYTSACNIGAHIARERGRKFLLVANNDITFRTDVARELHAEMDRDPLLAIASPSQIIVQKSINRVTPTYRVYWDLSVVDFRHDIELIDTAASRLEADFCELTCSLIRMSAIEEVGFLDDEYGFYHEDADFGFRLRKAGYGCAYLPKSQIDHFTGSTFNRDLQARKDMYVAKNKLHFAKSHLGYGVHHAPPVNSANGEQAAFDQALHPYLRRYGLLERGRPELVVGYPAPGSSGYLFTTEATGSAERWLRHAETHDAIFTTSARLRDRLASLGAARVFHAPFGIEPDIFHPWAPSRRLYDETTYLAFVDGGHQAALRQVIEAWHRFMATGAKARLILLGSRLDGCLGRSPDHVHRARNLETAHYGEASIDTYEVIWPIEDADLLQIYRAVDFTLLGPGAKGASLWPLQSQASGTPCIFDGEAFTLAASQAGAAAHDDLFTARMTPRDRQAHAGIADTLLQRFTISQAMSCRERAALSGMGVDLVRGRSTLRHTIMSLYRALTGLQTQDATDILNQLELRQTSIVRTLIRSGDPSRLATTMARRASTVAAWRVQRAGHLAARFGAVWQERGLLTAGREAAGRLGGMLGRRAARFRPDALMQRLGRATQSIGLRANQAVPEPGSALLIGYIDAQLGLGQSMRGLALAMSEAGTRFSILPFGIGVEGRRGEPYMQERYDLRGAHAVNIIEVTPDELRNVFAHLPAAKFDRSYNILRTYWELSKAPEDWRPKLSGIDEIWAPTRFVAESFRTIFDGRITLIPPCVPPAAPVAGGHRRFGLDPEDFHFLFSFDYFSFPQRKNPLGVVRAFLAAFPDPAGRQRLVIKSTGSTAHFPQIKEELRAAARYDDRITVIDGSLTRQDMLALMCAADCYVSLHRSEGFGLGMAEAMTFGKPVIGTDYSGNADFLTNATGYPIPYVLRPVGADEYVHADGQVWAEPDEAACAAAMRRVFDDPAEAAARAAAGRCLIAEQYGPLHVGQLVDQRLQDIFAAGLGCRPAVRRQPAIVA